MITKRYILVADNDSARIFKSDTAMRELEVVHSQSNPDGRTLLDARTTCK